MSKRRILTPETKVAIVRAHLLDGLPISDLCDKHGIHATQYYTWQKQLFENGAGSFARKTNSANARRQDDARQKQIEQLSTSMQVNDKNHISRNALACGSRDPGANALRLIKP